MKRLPDPVPACAYCGAPATKGRTCGSCRDLEQLDPHAAPARKPASEHELGVRNQHKVPKRGGRDELY